MGNSGSKSKVKQIYETNIVNKSDIDILNKSINDFVTNTVVNQASKCSANITQLQTVDLSNMKVAGDFNIGEIDQKQTAAITFDCVQVSSFSNTLANGIMTQYVEAMKNNMSVDTLDKITTAADAKMESGFLNTGGGGGSSSKIKTDYKYNMTNETSKSIQNIIQNSITNNLDLDDLQECVASIKSSQEVITAGTEVGGNVNIGVIRQDQAATLLGKCVQQRNNANDITNQIVNDLGLTIDETNSVKKTTETDTKATAKNEAKGVFESLGDGIGGVFGGIGNLFGGLMSNQTALIASSICVVIIIIVILVFLTQNKDLIEKGMDKMK